MQALDVIVGVVNKKFLQSLYAKRRGPKGYGHARIIRLLTFAHAIRIYENKTLVKYLRKHPNVAKKLGFKTTPSRRSIRRWKEKYALILPRAVDLLGQHYRKLRKVCYTALDSTPMRDSTDPDAKSGKNSKGWFRGFKLHVNSDDLRVPQRATVTTGNIHDKTQASYLFVPSPATLADAAYDAKDLREEALEKETLLIADENPRRGKKKRKRPIILKKLRYIVEQNVGLLKNQAMRHSWTKVKGLANKTTFALSAVIFVQALAIYTLQKTGEVSLHVAEVML